MVVAIDSMYMRCLAVGNTPVLQEKVQYAAAGLWKCLPVKLLLA